MSQQILDPKQIGQIEGWGHARNIINGADAKSQFFKLVSELGEWAEGVTIGDRDEVIDGIGDAFVVMTIMSRQLGSDIITLHADATTSGFPHTDLSLLALLGRLADNLAKGQDDDAKARIGQLAVALVKTALRYGLDVNTCLLRAYNDIKDRVGVMYNGVYVKSTDPRFASIIEELKQVVA